MTADPEAPPRVRLLELDRVRGLAIVFMLCDHLAYIAGPVEVRLTIGRLSMPLFFLLAGGLAARLTRRHLIAALIGLTLPLVAPWAGSPNVLLVLAVGCLLLTLVPAGWSWLFAAVALAFAANRAPIGATSYDPAALIGLMALGQTIGLRWAVQLGSRLPDWLSVPGRRPLTWYVGNVLLIQGVVLWLSRV